MLQNVQAIADIPRLADDNAHDLFSQNETLKIVTCPICQAVYLPAFSQQEVDRSSFAVLEAAFLHVCHFCFRCQRPACPQCWNPVHHVCTACGEEAHLPFLSPVPSLEGLVFAPTVLPQQEQTAGLPLTCMRNGRFYLSKTALPKRMRAASRIEASPPPEPLAAARLATITQPASISALACSSYPPWLQGMLDHQAEHQIATPKQAATYQEHQPLAIGQGTDEVQTLKGNEEGSIAQGLECSLTSADGQVWEPGQQDAATQVMEERQISVNAQALERNQVSGDVQRPELCQVNVNTQAVERCQNNAMVQARENNLASADGQVLERRRESTGTQSARSSWEQPKAHLVDSRREQPETQLVDNSQGYPETQLAGSNQMNEVLRAAHANVPATAWPGQWEEIVPSSQRADSFGETAGTLAEAIARAQRQSSGINLIAWIENVGIVIMAAILLALILMIALAARSAHMNAVFLHLIHVDIRAEIAYLFQAI